MDSIAFLSNFTLAPIFEMSSGRPFNILSNQDTNNDQSNQTDRPQCSLTERFACRAQPAACR